MKPYYEDGSVTIYHGDALEVLPELGDNTADLILTDPPYFKVKADDWDRQWKQADHFLEWLDGALEQMARIMVPNGSLYLFASPQMAARVEVTIGQRFAVLNRIRWTKDQGWHKKAKQTALRSYLSPWEEIIFAEHFSADNMAKCEAGYAAKCDELRGFVFEPLRAYIVGEFERAGMLNTAGKIAANVACGFSASSGGMASRHYFSRSQWCLPTREHYEAMRALLNGEGNEYLRRGYEDLRRDYEDLRRDYEDLRLQYEELRRPFSVTAEVPFTDVWTFPTVQAYPGKHPCEKPLSMLDHMVTASSRPDAVVLDPFMGSGSTLVSAKALGRKAIGIEKDERYCRQAVQRLEQETLSLAA